MALKINNYLQFLEHVSEPIYWFDRHGRIVFANNAACTQLGYTNPELLRLSVADFDRQITAELWPEIFISICKNKFQLGTSSYIRRDGSHCPVQISFSSAKLEDEFYICALVREITPDQPDELLKVKLHSAVENSLDAFYMGTSDGRILHVNQSACKALGYSYAELTALSTLDIDPNAVIRVDGTSIVGGMELDKQRGVFESSHRRKDGSTYPVELTYNYITFDEAEYFFAFARDISKRKEMELQQEELRFIVDHATDAVYIYGLDGRIRYANSSAIAESGYTQAELLSMSIIALDPTLTPESWAAGWDNIVTGQNLILESVHRRKDGSTYPVEISAMLATFGGVQYGSAFVRNITERKQASREAEELRFIVEKSVDHGGISDV